MKKKDIFAKYEGKKKILSKVPKEQSPTHMMGGVGSVGGSVTFLWQPHNYRLYFDFDRKTLRLGGGVDVYKILSQHGLGSVGVRGINSGAEWLLKDLLGCDLRVKRCQVEVLCKWHHKQWRVLSGSVGDIDGRIDEVVSELDGYCLRAFKRFIGVFGGSSKFRVLKRVSEDGVKGESFLDSLPPEMIIHDTFFKKVYAGKVEFKGHVAVKNYVSNRAVESVVPEIASELREVSGAVRAFSDEALPVLSEFSRNMVTHVAVMKGIESSFKRFNKLLASRQTKLGEFK